MKSIGERITELRTAGAMSQQTLADALFVSRDLVSKWETDVRRPDYRMIEKMAVLFGVPADSIVSKKDLVWKELLVCFPDVPEISEEALAALLNSFLRRTKARNAELFLRRYYFRHSTAEIAAAYGIRENHVRSILSKMRKRLKKAAAEETYHGRKEAL